MAPFDRSGSAFGSERRATRFGRSVPGIVAEYYAEGAGRDMKEQRRNGRAQPAAREGADRA